MSSYLYRYKYVGFNEKSVKILDDCTIKFTHPSEFNDPFDCLPIIDKNEFFLSLLADPDFKNHYTNRFGSLDAAYANKEIIIDELQNFHAGFLSSTLKNVGILSLSKTPKSILMWSHYATNHTGFVVEFKISLDCPRNELNIAKLSEMLYPFPVKYDLNRPVVSLATNPNESLQNGLLIKHSDWSYEQEERVIDLSRGPGIHKFDPKLITSIIAGMKMSERDYQSLQEKVQIFNSYHQTNIKLFKCNAVKDRFEIEIENFKN